MKLPYGSSASFTDGLLNDVVNAIFHGWNSDSKRVRVFLGFLLLMNFRTFEYFPGFRLVQDSWYFLSVVVFFIAYPLLKIVLDWSFTRVELYFLACLPVLVILPAITSHFIFGQPYVYGVLQQRSAVLVMWWLLLINAWRLRWINESDIEKSLVFVSWATFFLFNLIRLTLNPAHFAYVGFTVGGESFTFPADFAVFAVFYYTFRGLRLRRPNLYLLAAAQFISALGHSGRSLSVVVVAILIIYLFRIRGFIRAVPLLVFSSCAFALLVGVSYIVAPKAVSERSNKFADAFKVAAGASEVQDVSANARIYETDTAKQYVAQYPLFGAGDVSKQWNGGLVSAIGAYFVPGDIGLVGIAFKYGILGLLFFSAQYLFCFSFISGAGTARKSPLLDATRGAALFTAAFSLVTGQFVFSIESTSFYIIVITLASSKVAERSPSHTLERISLRSHA